MHTFVVIPPLGVIIISPDMGGRVLHCVTETENSFNMFAISVDESVF